MFDYEHDQTRNAPEWMPEGYLDAADPTIFVERLQSFIAMAGTKWSGYRLCGWDGGDARPGYLPVGCCHIWPGAWRLMGFETGFPDGETALPVLLSAFGKSREMVPGGRAGQHPRCVVNVAVASWAVWFGVPLDAALHMTSPGCQNVARFGGRQLIAGMRMEVVATHLEGYLRAAGQR